MAEKPTYKELEQKVKELEKEALERKRVEEELKTKHAELEEIFKAIPDAVVFADLNRNITKINPGFTRLYGYKPEEIYGKKTKILYVSEEEFIEQGKARYNPDAKETYHPYEIDYRNKNGDIFHSETVGTPVRSEKGEALGLLAIVRDVSDRKKVEEELRESEEKYRSMMEAMKDPVYICSPDFRVEYMNPAMIRRTGRDATGEFCFKALHNLDEKCAWCMHHKAQQGEYVASEIVSPKDNHSYHISASPVVHRDGSISKMTVFRDITEHRKMEEQLRLQAEITSHLSEGVYLIRVSDGVILYTNPRFEEIFGYGPGEMVGKHVSIVNAPTEMTPEERVDQLVGIIKKTGSWRGEIQNIRKNGTPFWCYASASLYDHPEYGEIIISVHADITERKQAEEALRRSERELYIRNKIATIFLTIPDDEMYGEVLQAILEAMESKYGIFGYIDENGDLIVPSMTRDIWEKCQIPDKTIVYPPDAWGGIWGKALIEKRSLYANEGLCVPEGHIPVTNALVVPIIYTGDTIGLLEVANKENGYDEKDKELLGTFSIHIAPILNARLQRDRQEKKRHEAEEALKRLNDELLKEHNQRKILSKRLIDLLEKDRQRVAMELHDHVGQTLTSLKMNLEMIHGKLQPGQKELERQITTAQKRTIQTLKDVKNVSHGLWPATLEALGLESSLRELFNEIQQQTDMEIHFFSRGIPDRFEKEKELAIYRITQEALGNIVKHARAKHVFVNLVKKDEKLSLSVEDDGVGFDRDRVIVPSTGKGPLGLLIMRERSAQLGGEFTLESEHGKGTHLLMEIPV